MSVKLKPDIFNGSVPLREFLSQFNLIACANHWDERTKTVVLISCLRGEARTVLEGIQNLEDLDFVALKTKLELRYGEAQSAQAYYTQFTNRKQKFGESAASLGSDIERLARLVYPELTDAVRDKFACAQFISALTDGFVKRTIQLEGITSLRFAIERAKTIRIIQENSFGHKKDFQNSKERRKESENGKEGENNKEKREKEDGKGKFSKNKNGVKFGNKRECWECGKEGHFRSECPGKAGTEMGNKE
ncbi:hypothetical protein ALC62_05960 [Cyphomyrmex costatus]|uniref:CCHC-type domain-containing protein n=1 Tax=Cyphomyrmex costatus TaxID=456900 RepID=A0A151K289_9HYME|nr:hypothetical protein ALC62_05960 [Cyphomyrmex costatus]